MGRGGLVSERTLFALSAALLAWFVLTIVILICGFDRITLIGRRSFNVRQELRSEVVVGHVFGLFDFSYFLLLSSLHFNLVDDVERAAVVTL